LGAPGFPRVFTLERFALVVRQRMEFLKRLYSPNHGFYAPDAVPLVEGNSSTYMFSFLEGPHSYAGICASSARAFSISGAMPFAW
jgi:hypothetical protein